MYALVAEMHAINASVEAMKVENVERDARGEAIAWPYDCFNQAQRDLEAIAKRLREEI
jgi:hypothetical protein